MCQLPALYWARIPVYSVLFLVDFRLRIEAPDREKAYIFISHLIEPPKLFLGMPIRVRGGTQVGGFVLQTEDAARDP